MPRQSLCVCMVKIQSGANMSVFIVISRSGDFILWYRISPNKWTKHGSTKARLQPKHALDDQSLEDKVHNQWWRDDFVKSHNAVSQPSPVAGFYSCESDLTSGFCPLRSSTAQFASLWGGKLCVEMRRFPPLQWTWRALQSPEGKQTKQANPEKTGYSKGRRVDQIRAENAFRLLYLDNIFFLRPSPRPAPIQSLTWTKVLADLN